MFTLAREETGLGYTYADVATAHLIDGLLAPSVKGRDAFSIPEAWLSMVRAIRNLGRPGIASMAISAVDTALWDLKARLLGVPLVSLFGAAHDRVPIYGSGGFTSYSIEQLQRQVSGWTAAGIPRVKMKIGSDPDQDVARVRAARKRSAKRRNSLSMPMALTIESRHSDLRTICRSGRQLV